MPATVKKSPAMEPAHRACAGSSPGRHPVIFRLSSVDQRYFGRQGGFGSLPGPPDRSAHGIQYPALTPGTSPDRSATTEVGRGRPASAIAWEGSPSRSSSSVLGDHSRDHWAVSPVVVGEGDSEVAGA